MLTQIKHFFQSQLSDNVQPTSGNNQHQLNLACAALLIEVATIDNQFDQAELDTLSKQLVEQFNITQQACNELIALAKQEHKDATSTYQFTQLINNGFNEEQKFLLIRGMWLVAYADGNLDKYEEHIIRKVADLIHVSHAQFIKAKIEARDI